MTYEDIYDPGSDFDTWYTNASFRAISSWVRPNDRVLELGCATGLMTASLAAAGARVVGVDKVASFLETARSRDLPGVRWVHSDLTTYDDGTSYDHVIATSVIHELEDPLTLLRAAAARLAPGGLVHITTLNPRSLHRLVALETGLIDDLYAKSEYNVRYGVAELRDGETVRRLAHQVGLWELHRAAICLKPLPNDEMAKLAPEVLEGFRLAARWFPDNGALTYLVLGA